ncbi:MAG TPA: Type 1 glutamine amidotransferase-like domain-containing protein [Fimbriimonadaceae bacterium]|nr:Type 1 glutamine amidotransferase-like domain-containing protein [Fimbriimonadaceae bacterium]
MKIVAIGGGDMRTGETRPIDEEIVRLTGKSRPRALFFPTASFDDRDYAQAFIEAYGVGLGCQVDVLYLWEGYTPEEIEHSIQATKWNSNPHHWQFRGDPERAETAIEKADLVYVGGGNTKRMLELWHGIGVDWWLKQASERGAVLAGLSAGAICWARYGNSDFALTEGLGIPTGRIEGLDLLPMSLCPHMSREDFRFQEFKAMMRETPGVGVALDDCAALEVVDGRYRILSCLPGATGHRFTANSHRLLQPSEEFEDLSALIHDDD